MGKTNVQEASLMAEVAPKDYVCRLCRDGIDEFINTPKYVIYCSIINIWPWFKHIKIPLCLFVSENVETTNHKQPCTATFSERNLPSARQIGFWKCENNVWEYIHGIFLCAHDQTVWRAQRKSDEKQRLLGQKPKVHKITGTQSHTYTNTQTLSCLWEEFDANVQWKAEVVH